MPQNRGETITELSPQWPEAEWPVQFLLYFTWCICPGCPGRSNGVIFFFFLFFVFFGGEAYRTDFSVEKCFYFRKFCRESLGLPLSDFWEPRGVCRVLQTPGHLDLVRPGGGSFFSVFPPPPPRTLLP